MDKLYTLEEVAKMLGLSRRTMYRWVRRGWISIVVLPNGQIRVPSSEIEKLVRAPTAR